MKYKVVIPNLEELEYIPYKGMWRVPDDFWWRNYFSFCRIVFRFIGERCV